MGKKTMTPSYRIFIEHVCDYWGDLDDIDPEPQNTIRWVLFKKNAH